MGGYVMKAMQYPYEHLNRVPISQDRAFYPTEKAELLMHLWQAMEPCIMKCMFNLVGSYSEMIGQFHVLKDNCSNIIIKNMMNPAFKGVPPCTFASAVHLYILHQNLHSVAKWRLISAVFEYTAMEVEAECMKQAREHMDPRSQRILNWVRPESHDMVHSLIKETHQNVSNSRGDLQDIKKQLEDLLERVQK